MSSEENYINIITRTSNRVKFFNRLKKSIQSQTLDKNLINHIIITDDNDSLKYLEDQDNIILVKKHNTPKTIKPRNINRFFPHNYYFNDLRVLEQLKYGWVIFIDDDDMLYNHNSLEVVYNKTLKLDVNTILYWNIEYLNKRIIPRNLGDFTIKYGDITVSNFCFHSSKYGKIMWDDWAAADFRFIMRLDNLIQNRSFLDDVIIKVDNIGHGLKKDLIAK